MTRYRYHIVDVFTDRVFGGNQLAVVLDAAGLSDAQMQSVAGEFNLSETTFVLPPDDDANTAKVRIFTPGTEMPFAGHPTLGTAHVLATAGGLADGTTTEIVLEEGVGPVPVAVTARGESRTFARLTAAQLPVFGPPPPSREALAGIFSLSPDDIAAEPPIEAVSCGVPFLFLPLTGLDAMARLKVNQMRWDEVLGGYWTIDVFAWTRDTVHQSSDIHGRMFGPGVGVAEDPATGSAAAALAGYLGVREGAATGTARWRVEQGLEMNRPSFLDVEADKRAGEITAVRVGGSTVSFGTGELDVPDL